VEQVDEATRRVHGVVVEILLHVLPQFQGVGIELGIAGQEVVGAHDGGVAAHIAAADIALLDHRDIGDSMVLGEVVSRGQPVPAAADDDDIILGLRLRVAPGRAPAFVAGQPLFENLEGIVAHGSLP